MEVTLVVEQLRRAVAGQVSGIGTYTLGLLQHLIWLIVMRNCHLSLLSYPKVIRQNRYLVQSVRKLLSLNFWRKTKIGCGRTL